MTSKKILKITYLPRVVIVYKILKITYLPRVVIV